MPAHCMAKTPKELERATQITETRQDGKSRRLHVLRAHLADEHRAGMNAIISTMGSRIVSPTR